MKEKNVNADELRRDLRDIDVFSKIYIPQISKGLYALYGFNVVESVLDSVCESLEKADIDLALKKIRGCFRAINRRYPLDLRVYENTRSGCESIVQHFCCIVSSFLSSVENTPVIPEDEVI